MAGGALLPLDEDSWLLRVCLYYGLMVLVAELLVPLLFHRRVRVEMPRVALRGPATPLSTREFQQRRRALQQQVAALQRALAETPRRSPQKTRPLTAAKQVGASPSPSPSSSPMPSPTSAVKVARADSARKTNEIKRREDNVVDEQVQTQRQPPTAMGDSLATRTATARRGGFSFNEIELEEDREEKSQEPVREPMRWEQAADMSTARRRESPTFSGRRPVRLVSDDGDGCGYTGPSEAPSRLEALIRARRRQKASTSSSYVPPPSVVPARGAIPVSVPVAPSAATTEKPVENSILKASTSPRREIPSPLGQQNEQEVVSDEETKESEEPQPLSDFQAFCASFATGGSAAAQQAIAKRKHHEAFGSAEKQATGSDHQSSEKRKQPRVSPKDNEQVDSDNVSAVPRPDKRKHDEAFGPDSDDEPAIKDVSASLTAETQSHIEAFGPQDEHVIDKAIVSEHVLEKRSHDEAFGKDHDKERPQEKTPRIVRRISFGDELDALAATPSKDVPDERSIGKRKHQNAFGMTDDDDEDAEWRDSLAFRPHRLG